MKQLISSVVVRFGLALGLISSLVLSATASAQSYPSRTTHLLVGFPPGGATDLVARILAAELAARLGQPFIVENRAGAAGSIALQAVARAKPDGYMLGFGTNGAMTINVHMADKPTFEPLKELVPVAQIADIPMLILANQAAPFNNVSELISTARAQQGKLNFASTGVTTLPHLLGELFNRRAQVQMTHVPYKGGAPAALAIASGEVPFGFVDISSAVPFLKSGRAKGLAVTSAKRTKLAPDIPTIGESGGLSGFDHAGWIGLFAPAGLPAPISERLQTGIEAILGRPDIVEKMLPLMAAPAFESSAQFDKRLRAESQMWAELIRTLGKTSK